MVFVFEKVVEFDVACYLFLLRSMHIDMQKNFSLVELREAQACASPQVGL